MIPPELLELIFWECLDPEKMVKSQQQEVPVLLHLAQVCRYWRMVALSVPALWSSLDAPYDGGRISENNLRLLRLWLERSKNHPLTVQLPTQFDITQNRHLVKLPLDISQDPNPVIFDSSAVEELSRMGKLLNASLLQRIEFWHAKPGDSLAMGDLSPCLFAETLTSIKSLREIVWSCYVPHNVHDLQWPFLCSVTIDQVTTSANNCLLFLSQCPRLEKFHLGCYQNSWEPLREAITLPFLHFLHLETQDPENIDTGELLDCLILPSLRSLEISPPKDDLTLNRLGARSSCQLTNFTLIDWLDTISIWQFDAVVYMQTPCVTSVRSLTINHITLDDLVSFLTWHPQDASRQHLPFLEMIDLRCFTTDGLVSAMLASRNISGHQREDADGKFIRHPVRLTFAKLDLLFYPPSYKDYPSLLESCFSQDVAFFRHLNRLRVQGSLELETEEDDDGILEYYQIVVRL
ncbi:hypothetical protein H0H93_001663, partial [Arthromyces matolae]